MNLIVAVYRTVMRVKSLFIATWYLVLGSLFIITITHSPFLLRLCAFCRDSESTR